MDAGASPPSNSNLTTKMALARQPKAPKVKDGTIVDLTFPSPIPKDYLCLLCKGLLSDPCHITCCKSRYCVSCANRMLTTSYPCVKCAKKQYRKEVNDKDKGIKKEVQQLQVFCPMQVGGCLWSGKIKDLENHLCWGEFDTNETSNCRFLPVPCPKKCGRGVPRRDMEEHLQVDCESRFMTCGKCGFKGTSEAIAGHESKCGTLPVECPNGCKMPGIKQNRLSFHLDGECPLRLIACDYQHIGCDERLQFKDHQPHNERNIQEHFKMMSEQVRFLNTENERLTSLCLSIQDTCTKLQDQYDTLASFVVDSQSQQEGKESQEDMTYVVIKRNTLKRSPRVRQSEPLPPTVPKRTPSMMKSLSTSTPYHEGMPSPLLYSKERGSVTSMVSVFEPEDTDSTNLPPLPPKGIQTQSATDAPLYTALKKSTPPLPPKSRSETDSPPSTGENKPKKSPMLPPKGKKLTKSEGESDVSTNVKKYAPPPPKRRDSLSALTLPRRDELKHQRKHAEALQALTPIKDEPFPKTEAEMSPPPMNKPLLPSSKARFTMKSTPDLLADSHGNANKDGNLTDMDDDQGLRDRSWSDSSSKWASSSNPSYCPIRNIDILSRYEVYTEKNPAHEEGSPGFNSDEMPSSDDDDMSDFVRDYQNIITFKSETLPAFPVNRKVALTSRRPLPTPRMPKSKSIEDVGSAPRNANMTTSPGGKMIRENVANMYRRSENGGEVWSEADEPNSHSDQKVSQSERRGEGAVAVNPMYPTQSELQTKLSKRRSVVAYATMQ